MRSETESIPERWKESIPPAIIYIMFSVGILGHTLPLTHDLMIWLTPFFLFGMGLFVIYPSFINKDLKFLLWVFLTYVITFSIEAVGVETGAVFGEYSYGSALGFKLLEVPLVIGFNWVLVVVGAVMIAAKYVKNPYLASLLGGSIATLFDYFLEPVAIELDYWKWVGGDIPLQNYAAWFVIGTLISFSFLKLGFRCRSNLPVHYLFVQALFFLSLQLSFAF